MADLVRHPPALQGLQGRLFGDPTNSGGTTAPVDLAMLGGWRTPGPIGADLKIFFQSVFCFVTMGKSTVRSLCLPYIFNREISRRSRWGRCYRSRVLYSALQGGPKCEVPPLPTNAYIVWPRATKCGSMVTHERDGLVSSGEPCRIPWSGAQDFKIFQIQRKFIRFDLDRSNFVW